MAVRAAPRRIKTQLRPAGRIRFDRDRFLYELARRGLTASAIAKLAGVTEAALSRIANGSGSARPSTVRALAAALLEVPVIPGAELFLSEPEA